MRLESSSANPQQSQNIVKILRHGSFGPHTGVYFIDLQYCDINLDEYIRGLRPPWLALYSYAEAKGNDDLPVVVCGIMQQVLNGLIFIHEKGQVHRDLKPMNGTYFSPHAAGYARRWLNVVVDDAYVVLYSAQTGWWMIADFGVTSEGMTQKL